MKLPTDTKYLPVGILNAFTLTGVSMVWGHMLDLINPWFLPVAIVAYGIGFPFLASNTFAEMVWADTVTVRKEARLKKMVCKFVMIEMNGFYRYRRNKLYNGCLTMCFKKTNW